MRLSDEITTHRLHRKNLETIQDLILNLHSSQTLLDLSNVQERLYEVVWNSEEAQKSAKHSIKVNSHRQSELLRVKREGGKVDKVKLWLLQQEAKACELEVEVLKHILLQLRTVGDGLLWKATGYDRGYIGALSSAAGGGNLHLSDPAGLEQERRILKQYRKKGILAVHHDLTTSAKVGDLTLVFPSGRKAPIEVKRTRRPNSKQEHRISKISRIISGRFVALDDDDPAQILRSIRGIPKHHLDKYCDVLVEAGIKGYATRRITDYFSLTAFNFLHPRWDLNQETVSMYGESEALYQSIFNSNPGFLKSIFDRDRPVTGTWDSSEKVYVEEARFGAPWAIYPFSPDVCAYLTCGYLRFFVHFNFEAFLKRLNFAGFEAEVVQQQTVKKPNQMGEQQFFPVIKVWRIKVLKDGTFGNRFILLGRSILQQLLLEGLHFDTLVESIKPIFRGCLQVEDDLVFNHLSYIEDRSIWESLYLHPTQLEAASSGTPLLYYTSEATIISPKARL